MTVEKVKGIRILCFQVLMKGQEGKVSDFFLEMD